MLVVDFLSLSCKIECGLRSLGFDVVRLVNLPCPVELQKTHDHAMYFKCADVAQMLIVYEDTMALDEAGK